MARKLGIGIKPISGGLNKFVVFVNNRKVISGNGNKSHGWSGEVGDLVNIKVRAYGIGEAQYQLTIDLPGTADDQNLTFTLNGGYHEAEFNV